MRRTAYQILEGFFLPYQLGRLFAFGMAGLIIINVFAVLVQTEPGLADGYQGWFDLLEWVSVAIFTIEYVARVWTAPEAPEYAAHGPVRARLRYMISPFAVIDLIAILPFYLSFFGLGIDLRLLRAARLLRLLKLTRYSRALLLLGTVLVAQRRELGASLLVMIVLLLFTSTAMYLIERHAQPEAFASIPRAMWWAMATLTTVGYGDVSPVTPIGQIFGALAMVMGIGMFALPAGILATGFTEELQRHDFVVHWKTVARVPLFNKLNAVEIADITQQLNTMTLKAGEILIRKGDAADRMYFILAGKLQIVTAGNETLVREPGDFVGELALLNNRPRSADVRAHSDCRLLMLMNEDLTLLMAQNPHMRETIEAVAAERQAWNEAQETQA